MVSFQDKETMIKRKLRSDKGASITFALLIFLVCAVISSVVLVAATASSGRISNQAETDQRYYSVTSAAELLKELIGGSKASVKEVETSFFTTTYGVDSSMITQSDSYEKEDYPTRYYIVENGNETLLTDATGPESMTTFQQYAAFMFYKNTDAAADKSFLLTTDITESATDVTITEKVKKGSGDIELHVFNADYQTTGRKFELILTFDADVKTQVGTNATDATPKPADSGGYTIETTVVKTTTTTLTWALAGTRTFSA